MNITEGIIVCNNETKFDILRNIKEIKSFKFFTIKQLKNLLFEVISNEGILTIMANYGYSLDLATDIANYLPFVDLNKEYISNKINKLKEIKSLLISKNECKRPNELDLYLLANNHITLIDIDDNRTNQLIIDKLKAINNNVENYNTSNKVIKDKVCSYKTIELECMATFNKIIELNKKGIRNSDIVIYNVDSDYDYYLKRISKHYNIPLNLEPVDNILSLGTAKTFINNMSIYDSFSECIENTNGDFYSMSKIINIIDSYSIEDEKPIKYIGLFKSLLKKIKVEKIKYKDGIDIVSELSFISNKYIFFMNFNFESTPKTYKDEEYLSDIENMELGLATASDRNSSEKQRIISILNKANNLFISYKEAVGINSFGPSNLIQELELETVEASVELGYSEIEDDLRIGVNLDNYYKYKINDEDISKYDARHLGYNSYDNSFKGIEGLKLNNYFSNKKLRLAYTSLSKYYSCPFKYYAEGILKLNDFEESLSIRLGNYGHELLEKSYSDSFNIDTSVDQNKYCIDSTDHIFMNRLKEIISKMIDFNKEKEGKSKLNYHLLEEEINLENNDYNFTGKLDKLLYTIEDDTIYACVIDYKTGSNKMSLNNIDDGANLQLPIYLYLLNNYDKFKNYKIKIVGIYLQKINILILKNKNTMDEDMLKTFRLLGYTNNNRDVICKLDNDYQNGDYLANIKENKDGSFSSSSLLISDDDVIDLIDKSAKLITEGKNKILAGAFEIKPKKIGDSDPCKNCSLLDICNRRFDDYIQIEAKKYGDD